MDLQQMLDHASTGSVHVKEGWGQGRATYGGLVGGLTGALIAGAGVEGLAEFGDHGVQVVDRYR